MCQCVLLDKRLVSVFVDVKFKFSRDSKQLVPIKKSCEKVVSDKKMASSLVLECRMRSIVIVLNTTLSPQ